MSRQNLSALSAALLLSWACSSALAQTSAKPAPPKPAAPATGKTLDGSTSSSSKVMSINELKECLRRQDELKASGAEYERQRAALDADREKVEQQTAAVKALKDEAMKRNEAVKEFNERLKAYSDSVAAWNAASTELGEQTGMSADRKRKQLNTELAALKKTEATNKTEGEALMAALQESVDRANTGAQNQTKMVNDWNERNAKLNDQAKSYEDSRATWRDDCGNRRYREDDEKALRAPN